LIAEIIKGGRVDYCSSLAIAVRQNKFVIGVHYEQFVTEDPQEWFAPLWADEEPEEVTGSCDVIGNVISDCKRRLM
jgi:hypothetical protein